LQSTKSRRSRVSSTSSPHQHGLVSSRDVVSAASRLHDEDTTEVVLPRGVEQRHRRSGGFWSRTDRSQPPCSIFRLSQSPSPTEKAPRYAPRRPRHGRGQARVW
jgi:hypothetical protein